MKARIVLALVAAVGLTAVWQWRSLAPPAAPEAAVAASDVAWPAGEKRVYTLTWSSQTRTPVAGQTQAFELASDLDADLVVRSLGMSGDAYELLVSLADVRRLEMHVQGKVSGTDERAAIVGHEALVRVDRTGAVRGLSFRATTPLKLRQMLINVVGALRVTLPDDGAATWTALEPTPIGTASVVYARSSDHPGLLERRRVEYTRLDALGALVGEDTDARQELEATGAVQLDASGALQSIHDEESFALKAPDDATIFSSRSRVALEPKGTARFEPKEVDVAAFDQKVEDGRVAVDPRRGDEQFASQITEERIVTVLSSYGAGARAPRGFMTRAGAFLRLHPEKERELYELFTAKNTPPRTRELLCDMWSVTGDAAAQKALREALAWGDEHVAADDQAQYVQRFTFVARPELASASFVTASYTRARDEKRAFVRGASAVALGAMAKKLAAGDAEERKAAAKARALLGADLARAKTPVERGALLEALGNAAAADDATLVARYATDEDDDVRESAALALRHMDAASARSALLDLVRDPTPRVARTAMRALRTQDLTPEDWVNLETAAVLRRTNVAADSTLVEFVRVQGADAGPHAAPILRAVLARTSDSQVDLRTTIHGMLDDPSAG
jgi:hypothetical protein